MTNDNQTKQPIFKTQLPGAISAAVFENEHDGKTYPSPSLRKSYKDKDGKWQDTTIRLHHRDIPFAITALQDMLNYLNSDYANQEVVAEDEQLEEAA